MIDKDIFYVHTYLCRHAEDIADKDNWALARDKETEMRK